MTTTTTTRRSAEQRYAVQANPASPSNGLNKQELPRSPAGLSKHDGCSRCGRPPVSQPRRQRSPSP